MEKDNKKTEEEETRELMDAWTKSRLLVFLQATGYTIATMAIIGTGTYYLDHYLETFPLIFIIGLVVAFPISQILVIRKTRLIAKEKTKKLKDTK